MDVVDGVTAAVVEKEAIDDAAADVDAETKVVADVEAASGSVVGAVVEESWVVDSKRECWDDAFSASEPEAVVMAVEAELEAEVELSAVEWKICPHPRCRCPCCVFRAQWEVEASQLSSSFPEWQREAAQVWLADWQHWPRLFS